MASSLGTTSSNNMIEDNVSVFVTYNGKWECDGKEWLFKDSKGSIMVVPKYVTLSQIRDILFTKLKVDQDSYGLKLEVLYRVGSPWFPIVEIECDEDLSLFILESSKAKLPLCVTAVLKDDIAEIVGQDEINPHGRKDDSIENRLIKAIRTYDWVKAREIVNTEEFTWTSKLDDQCNTALHFAVGRYKDNKVVSDILMGMDSKLLETTIDVNGRNPAHAAADFGNTEALKIICKYNKNCLFNADKVGLLAINYSLGVSSTETFYYMFEQMKSYEEKYYPFLEGEYGQKLLRLAIDKGLIDIANKLIDGYPSMATDTYKKVKSRPLEWIIRNPDLFYSGRRYNLCQRIIYHHVPIEKKSLGSTDTADVENQEMPKNVISRICFKLWETMLQVPYVKRLKDDKVKHNATIKLLRRICKEVYKAYQPSEIKSHYGYAFCLAVANNTAEVIDVLITYFGGLYYSKKGEYNIYQLTVLNRSEKVYGYILQHISFAKAAFSTSKDCNGNKVLHLAGRLAPIHKLNAASGAALQMQRELQWFEELKQVVGITQTRELNIHGETPMMVFRKEHMGLRKEAEEWMKKTAESYTITAALIITIVFAAAITVPGGNDSATGKPIYETKASLIIFAIADAISLFTSTTSLLLFLSILTARYADEDFLFKFPNRLIIGLVMLFVSVTSMMIAFSVTLYIMFGQGKAWILIPIGALACLPIASFVTLQFPLLVELISSTYFNQIFRGKIYHN